MERHPEQHWTERRLLKHTTYRDSPDLYRFRQALDLSHQLNIYAYDAYLIACSLQYRSPLLTVDGGLRDAARLVGVEVLEVAP
jgi:predicted nucleic acid-binding protein